MAANTTLLTVRTQVRQRTHYETSKFLDDTTELNVWITESYRELYDLLVAQFQGSFYFSSADFPIVSGNTFSVPADFYHLTGVDWIITAPDQLQTLRRIMFGERNAGRQGYDLRGNTVTILPYSWAAGKTFRFYYVPVPAALVNDGDTFDGVNGWEEYIVADTCIKVCGKSGEDPGVFGAQKAAMVERIAALAAQRDEGEPAHVQDVNQQGVYSALIGGRFIWDGVW